MKLVDTNVWLALALSKHASHAAARDWLRKQKQDESILFCRLTQQSFLRLITTSAVLGAYGIPALSNYDAWGVYKTLITDRRVAFRAEPAGVESGWEKLASQKSASPKLWIDAYLAAFAIAGDFDLVTFDRDFAAFEKAGLRLLILKS